MKSSEFHIDIFDLFAVAIFFVVLQIFYVSFIKHDYYPIFTTEEEIKSEKDINFGVFAEYL